MKPIYVFAFHPLSNTSPFDPIPGADRQLAFTDNDDLRLGYYLGVIKQGPKAAWGKYVFQPDDISRKAWLGTHDLIRIANQINQLNAKAHTESQASREEASEAP